MRRPGRITPITLPQTHSVRLSIIIPALDGAGTIGHQLDALARQERPDGWCDADWEIIVADNGSRDATLEIVKAFGERLLNLRLIDASARLGASAARNIGSDAASGDMLLGCGADDEADAGWLELTQYKSGALPGSHAGKPWSRECQP